MGAAKFCDGELVYNCITDEDGQVRLIYELNGSYKYQVDVPVERDSWAQGAYSSDWAENRLVASWNETSCPKVGLAWASGVHRPVRCQRPVVTLELLLV